jgi:hypothetical protein
MHRNARVCTVYVRNSAYELEDLLNWETSIGSLLKIWRPNCRALIHYAQSRCMRSRVENSVNQLEE